MHSRDETVPRHRRPGRHGDRDTVTILLAGAVLAAGAAVSAAGLRPDPVEPTAHRQRVADAVERPASRAADAAPARGAVVRAAAVLRAWDRRRARAYGGGDAAALRELYVDGAGAADVRLLRRYADRDLRVEGLTTQLLAVEVLGHAPGRWRLRVTDRVAAGVAVGEEGRLRLRRDRADTRVVELVRGGDGAWRVADVRAA